MSGKSKIEINPKADIGQYSGGNKVNTGKFTRRISSERL